MNDDKKLNRGAIWPNDRKQSETHPDFTGSLNVEGVEYFFDAWKRKPDANPKAPSLSFRIKKKDKQPEADDNLGWGKTEPAAGGPDPSDEIPFGPISAKLQQ